ncbi:MAG: CHRD domain-containing protein, partial [Candidatus Marinimicrobia bacterium]|nr:CHRD domain-containing protein [Candidatus Neomarinimicrobiota bacterium]
IAAAHFHKGAAGVAGGVVHAITDDFTGNTASGLWASADLTDALIADLLAGNLYVNVHTAANGAGEIRGQVIVTQPLILGIEESDFDVSLPSTFILLQNYPNPFNPSTQIRYDLPRAVPVTLTVYNILGRQVVTLVDELQAAGSYAVRWNGRDQQGKLVGTGVYVYRIQAGPQGALRKMVFLK